MKTQTWQLVLGQALARFSGGFQNAAAHSPKTDVRLTIHVRNYADVDSKNLASVERVAGQIFRNAGVETRWIDNDWGPRRNDKSAGRSSLNLSHIWLNILSPAMVAHLGLAVSFMGFAPGNGPERNVVYVFYHRIKELAHSQIIAWVQNFAPYPVSQDQILGAVIAHEIGHVLLNQPSHSKTGIMRGDWEVGDFHELPAGYLLFTSRQAEIIRAELVRRAGEREWPVVAKANSPTLTHEGQIRLAQN